MITWMTRMSFMDTADDLNVHLAALQLYETQVIWTDLAAGGDELPAGHPAKQMWTGYETALAVYGACMAARVARLGVQPGLEMLYISKQIYDERQRGEEREFIRPPWLEDADVLRSHRSNMARRWPKQFSNTYPGTPALMPYIWPFVDDEGGYRLVISKHDKGLLASGERRLPANIKKRIANL